MFAARLLPEISLNLDNNYSDNFDPYRFGEKQMGREKLEQKTHNFLLVKGFIKFRTGIFKNIMTNIDKFNRFYDGLRNENPKDLLVKLLAYRILGERKVKLPLSQPKYWNDLAAIEKAGNKSDTIDPGFMHYKLYKYELKGLGFPIELYFTSKGIFTDYVLKQYEYHQDDIHIKAEAGDYLVDSGGCWGDTILFAKPK